MVRFDMSVVERKMSLTQRRRQHLIFVMRKRDGLRPPLATVENPSGSRCLEHHIFPRVLDFVLSLSANFNGQTYIIAIVDAILIETDSDNADLRAACVRSYHLLCCHDFARHVCLKCPLTPFHLLSTSPWCQ